MHLLKGHLRQRVIMDERGVDGKEQSPAIIGTQVDQKSALIAIAPKLP